MTLNTGILKTLFMCKSIVCILGMHFCQAVAIIQSQVGIIKGVQVLYSDKVF